MLCKTIPPSDQKGSKKNRNSTSISARRKHQDGEEGHVNSFRASLELHYCIIVSIDAPLSRCSNSEGGSSTLSQFPLLNRQISLNTFLPPSLSILPHHQLRQPTAVGSQGSFYRKDTVVVKSFAFLLCGLCQRRGRRRAEGGSIVWQKKLTSLVI